MGKNSDPSKYEGNCCCMPLENDEQCCNSAVRKHHQPWHIYLFMMNVSNPGYGTIWSACCCTNEACQCCNILIGYAQYILAMFVAGWIWSIKWGCSIYWKGKN